MATNFPTAIDDGTSLPDPTAANNTNSPSLAGQQATQNGAIKAIETKLGTGSSTPASGTILYGTGAGTSAFQTLTSSQLAGVLTDETGTGSAVFGTTPTLITPKVDTINESTPGNGTTIGGVSIKSGALVTSNSVVAANITASAVDYTKVATGFAVQQAGNVVTAMSTSTIVLPLDDTIPQNTEGAQFLSQAITPKLATSILVISVVLYLAPNTSDNIQVALFQDTTANAIAAMSTFQSTNTAGGNISFIHQMASGTTSSTTFKVRAGCNGANTLTVNGSGGVRRLGGVIASSITITEYKA